MADAVAAGSASSTLASLEKKASDLSEKLIACKSELESAQAALASGKADFDQAQKDKTKFEEEELRKDMRYKTQQKKYKEDLDKLTSVHAEVVQMENKLRLANAENFQAEMKQLEDEAEATQATVFDLQNQLARLKAQDETSRRRALNDAIEYRRMLKEQSELEARIDEQRQLTNGQTSEDLEAKIERLDKEMGTYQHSKSSKQGMIQTLTQDIHVKRADLTSKLKRDGVDVQEQHAKTFVTLETTKLAYNDLAVALDVLDKSLMKYHSTKMSDINHILKELWEATYQGKDIDYVKIVAEADESATSTTPGGKTQKNFNYRVVMVKGGVELDMRGRCSAGQKVLASLMIRMALSETFCLNCGILALDEPTSNLDRDNVEALAESLRKVIEIRQKQANFQLIIITHDEDFVKIISRNAWTDEYYKVKKDATTQQSVIRKRNVRDLK